LDRLEKLIAQRNDTSVPKIFDRSLAAPNFYVLNTSRVNKERHILGDKNVQKFASTTTLKRVKASMMAQQRPDELKEESVGDSETPQNSIEGKRLSLEDNLLQKRKDGPASIGQSVDDDIGCIFTPFSRPIISMSASQAKVFNYSRSKLYDKDMPGQSDEVLNSKIFKKGVATELTSEVSELVAEAEPINKLVFDSNTATFYFADKSELKARAVELSVQAFAQWVENIKNLAEKWRMDGECDDVILELERLADASTCIDAKIFGSFFDEMKGQPTLEGCRKFRIRTIILMHQLLANIVLVREEHQRSLTSDELEILRKWDIGGFLEQLMLTGVN